MVCRVSSSAYAILYVNRIVAFVDVAKRGGHDGPLSCPGHAMEQTLLAVSTTTRVKTCCIGEEEIYQIRDLD